MRELLDRLLEARTAMDDKLRQADVLSSPWSVYPSIPILWLARYHLWKATLLVLEATGEASTSKEEENPVYRKVFPDTDLPPA